MYHRGLVALRGADATLQAAQVTVRVADANGNFDTSGVTEWAGKALPPRVADFQKDFITKYMDPTEIYTRMDPLTTQFPDIMQAINLPNKTGGYQPSGDGDDGGHHRGQRHARARPWRPRRST